MGQASLFSREVLAAMRDRTASRNYSAVGQEFRRAHERHRAWGLQRRHAEKLRRLRQSGSAAATAPADGGVEIHRATPTSTPVVNEPQSSALAGHTASATTSRRAVETPQRSPNNTPPPAATQASRPRATLAASHPSEGAPSSPHRSRAVGTPNSSYRLSPLRRPRPQQPIPSLDSQKVRHNSPRRLSEVAGICPSKEFAAARRPFVVLPTAPRPSADPRSAASPQRTWRGKS
jgi:hypothetical protein